MHELNQPCTNQTKQTNYSSLQLEDLECSVCVCGFVVYASNIRVNSKLYFALICSRERARNRG